MSKIKDLYAIENGIDDLIPPRKPDLKQVAERVASQVNYEWAMAEYKEKAEFSEGYDDEGHKRLYFENFIDISNSIARDVLDAEIENDHIDLTDEEYKEVKGRAADIIADNFSDKEEEIIEEEMERYKEAYEDFLSYNNLTLPKE